MSIGLVSDAEFEKELSSVSRPISKPSPGLIKPIETPGRSNGDVNVPSALRTIIGETGAVDSRQDALALGKMYGISPSSVSAYTNGASSTASYNKPDEKIANPIAKARARIARKSRLVMSQAIDAITEDKLEGTKARDLAGIAKDLAGVVRVMEENNNPNDDKSGRPPIIIYVPQMRIEESFEVIDVQAQELA